jgi:3-deoxy-7-phosphoheptulonate synthase
MVDCSHGNSQKDHTKQALVIDSLCEQISAGETAIFGTMIESNLLAGKQDLNNKDQLTYGQSITDACIDWNETETLLEKLAKASRQRREK